MGIAICVSYISVPPRLRVQDCGTLPTLALHKGKEVIKKVSGVVGAGRSLRMVLNRVDGQCPVPHTFKGLVVQVDVGKFNVLFLE